MSKADSKHTPAEILRAARALISDEKNWTQGTLRKVRDGNECYCALGAMEAALGGAGAYGVEAWEPVCSFVRGALPEGYIHGVALFNDTSPHAEVLSLFDRAIAKAEGRAQ